MDEILKKMQMYDNMHKKINDIKSLRDNEIAAGNIIRARELQEEIVCIGKEMETLSKEISEIG